MLFVKLKFSCSENGLECLFEVPFVAHGCFSAN